MKLLSIFFVYCIFSSFGAQEKINTIYFDTNVWKLDSTQIVQLQNLTLNANNITITAYADERGTHSYNLALSKRRALSVIHELEKHFPNKNFNVQAKGEIPGNWKNARRVDLFYPATLEDKITNAQVGESLSFSTIHFEGGKDIVLPKSLKTLDSIAVIFIQNPNIQFEIRGHICCADIGQESLDGVNIETNQRTLSVDRAKAVFEYFLEKGIDKNRMRFKGMAAKEIDRNRSNNYNRRVEFVIIER